MRYYNRYTNVCLNAKTKKNKVEFQGWIKILYVQTYKSSERKEPSNSF